MIFGAIQVAGGFMVGIAWYKLWRRRKDGIDTVEDGKVVVGDAEVGGRDKKDYLVWFRSLRVGAVVGLIGFMGVGLSGHMQAQLMIHQQPLKMAAAEAACHDGTGFSVLSISSPARRTATKYTPSLRYPAPSPS